MNEMKYIKINKNRGWRGLAEVQILDEDKNLTAKHIFSFSQKIWRDLINYHTIVIQDSKQYHVIHFTVTIRGLLPTPTQQRSVLIKNFMAEIDHINQVPIDEWQKAPTDLWLLISNFNKNKNNHTTSDWNCIGIRVVPEI